MPPASTNVALRQESLSSLAMSNTLQVSGDKPQLSGPPNFSRFLSFAAADLAISERFGEAERREPPGHFARSLNFYDLRAFLRFPSACRWNLA
jgi:hypothetical protein